MSSGKSISTSSRRTFLRGAGLVASASALAGFVQQSASAEEAAGYQVENGFISLTGAYGKITKLACDPTGKGRYEATAFSSIFLGPTDYFDARFNGAVTSTLVEKKLSVAGIQMPSPMNLRQQQLNAPVQLNAGQSLGQTFTAKAYRFTRVGGQFPTWSNASSALTLTLYLGTPETGLTEILSRRVDPVQDNGWAYLDVPAQAAGNYYLEASAASGTPGWWAYSGTPTVDLGGAAYAGRLKLTGRSMTVDVVGFTVDGVASWDFDLNGSTLKASYEVQWSGAPRADMGLTFNTSWVKSGYSIDHEDGVLFSRFVGDDGYYIPSQQLKRRAAWENPVLGTKWIEATGTGSYDLRFTAPQPSLKGTMASDSMKLSLNSGTTEAMPVVARSLSIDIKAHSSALPDAFPVFLASDDTRAEQLSTFYWERALSFRFSGHAADWADWEGRILDWTGTVGAREQLASLLNTKQDDDGYVWSWPDSQGWPFPDPKSYDSRHFTSNAMYILATCRYFSWSGDSSFLNTMLPRARKAMDFYLNSLGGHSGIITIGSPDHDGRDGSVPSNYWDITSHGYLDAYANAYFYGALEAMAQLEDYVKEKKRANELRALRPIVMKRFNELFWNDKDGRYIQSVDVDGVVHDYGATYVNLEAASFGLPSNARAARIFDWLGTGHTELQDSVVLIEGGSQAPKVQPGHTMGQSFTAGQTFVSVAARFATYNERGAAFTMTLFRGLPGSATQVKVADRQFSNWGDGGVAHIELPKQDPGEYYLEVSKVTGTLAWWSSATAVPGANAYTDGVPASDARSRFVAALGEYYEGPADIYSKWVFAPRATTRRNSYWFFLNNLTTPWGHQVQDGGAILYTSGFDVMARAKYLSADDAWARLTAILDRWSEPDHISGGTPLFRGESTVDSGTGSTSVGTDIPFPESGLVAASFMYAFVGVEAEPDALVFTPNLPSTLSHAGVRNLFWHGKKFEVQVTRKTITVEGSGISVTKSYKPGETVRLKAKELRG